MNLTRIMMMAALTLPVVSASAQDWDREKQDPRATEVWEPIPPKVTPGKNGSAPSDAIVLFDGTSLTAWASDNQNGPAEWTVENGMMTVKPGKGGIHTKQSFGDCQLHVEWRAQQKIEGEGQGRSNSGIFLMGQYEVQVLDSYESRTYSNGQASSVYKQYAPLVNACNKPEEWQTYDIIFSAPVFDEKGRLDRPATVTVLHNGVLVQNHVTLLGGTQYKGLPVYQTHGKLPIGLQDHGNLVSFRNIWIREL
ncbi:MAG: DUF1080 domain-containing protein [Bacteroidia bacterium]|nr:DUF1080 domain-containing protein [Bacteroidia bacterium]